MKPFGIIYKITNKHNQKIYIGQTVDLTALIQCYRSDKKHPIAFALHKYGMDSFTFDSIDTAESQTELDEKEKFYIKALLAQDKKIGYNVVCVATECVATECVSSVLDGGKKGRGLSGPDNPMYGKTGPLNPFYGRKHTKESIQFIKIASSIAMKGKHHSQETKDSISRGIREFYDEKGRVPKKKRLNKEELSLLRSKNTSIANSKRVFTQNQKQKLSIRVMGENNPKAKLNQQLANQLREFYKNLTCETVKEKYLLTKQEFNVGKKTIWEIVSNRRWVNK